MKSPFTTILKFAGGVAEIEVTDMGINLNVGVQCMGEISACITTLTRTELHDLRMALNYIWDQTSWMDKKPTPQIDWKFPEGRPIPDEN